MNSSLCVGLVKVDKKRDLLKIYFLNKKLPSVSSKQENRKRACFRERQVEEIISNKLVSNI